MKKNVDVVVVMDEMAGKIWRQDDSDPILAVADEARAAVSELIEATTAYLDVRKWYNPLYANKRQCDAFAAIEYRLTAALVRVGGVA